jgi:hypothetical protein
MDLKFRRIQFIKIAVIISLLLNIYISAFSNVNVVNIDPMHLEGLPTAEYMMQKSNMGTSFYFAIPQNDIKSGLQEEILAIYVCSYTDTKIKLTYPRLGIEKNREVKAFKPTVLSSKNNDASFNWEVTESEVIGAEAVIITSDDPIAVYVLNSRNISSDGFLVIPTSAWGNKYIHSAYYDHYETWPSVIKRGGGFIIVAAHDGTSIEIKLNGTGENVGNTVGNRKIGETIKITLQSGQTYMVRGSGTNIAFDLTGTTIEASKPIGVISFHQRTMVPNKCPNGRDHLSEMLLPVQSWGKEFVTMEFNRGGQGDFFRVVASEDNTRIIADQHFPGSGNLIPDGHIETVLNKGQFWEYLQTSCGNNNTQNGVRGVTVWKADKPIQIMQIAYSFPWDKDSDWDPLMILVPPVKQFQKSSLFMPPVDAGFQTNEFTFFAFENSDDPERNLLNSIQFDNEQLSKNYQQFLYNHIPGTDLYWGRINISQGVHTINSKTKIYGYINGFTGYNSYGWPAMMGTNKINELDTLPPVVVKSQLNCGDYLIKAYEQRNGYGGNSQLDQGLRNIYLIKEASFNYKMTIEKKEKFRPELFITQQNFLLNVLDITKDAKAYFIVGDRAGNFIIDSVKYIAPKANYNPNGIEFKNKRLYKLHTLKYNIKNLGDDIVYLKDIVTKKGIRFTVVQNSPTYILPDKILPRDSIFININYLPISENTDEDSLVITSDCITIAVPVKGNGVYPKISTDNWNGATVEINKTVCYEHINGRGLRIANYGSDTLNIIDIIQPELPFHVSNPTYPNLPFKIAPSETKYFESLCFSPVDTGQYKSQFVFVSDDKLSDSVVSLSATAYNTVNVNDSEYSEFFSIRPNPALDRIITINYSVSNYTNTSIKIYDAIGKLCIEPINQFIESGNYNLDVNIEDLSNGVYYIVYTQNNRVTTYKLIINKS